MADFGISESVALAGMAASAAAAASSMAAQRSRMNAVDKLRKKTQRGIEMNRQQAEAIWKDALSKASPEKQAEMTQMNTDQRMEYLQNLAGAAQPSGVLTTTANTPKVINTENAKQLGTALDSAKNYMASQAAMSGWNKTKEQIALDLARSGEKINMYGNFSSGLANAAEGTAGQIMAAQPAIPLGDILSGAGQVGMQAGPEIGGGFGAAKKPLNWADIAPVNTPTGMFPGI